MTSILQRSLGTGFEELHPRIRQQYALTSRDGHAWVGRGVMERIWRGPLHMVPFLKLGASRRVMFAETGENIPFKVENYAYTDGFGRETLTWTRTFYFGSPKRFDETLIYSESRRRPVVYAGTHQHLAVDLEFSVGPGGSLELRTGRQRLYEWSLGIPFPPLLTGVARVIERYNDELERYEVDVSIANPVWGKIFGYTGWFTLDRVDCSPGDVPSDVRPIREERRE